MDPRLVPKVQLPVKVDMYVCQYTQYVLRGCGQWSHDLVYDAS